MVGPVATAGLRPPSALPRVSLRPRVAGRRPDKCTRLTTILLRRARARGFLGDWMDQEQELDLATEPRRRDRRSREDVSEALIDAAAALASERGSGHVTVRDIATRAGVNATFVHRYYGSKQNLMRAAMKRAQERLAIADRGGAGRRGGGCRHRPRHAPGARAHRHADQGHAGRRVRGHPRRQPRHGRPGGTFPAGGGRPRRAVAVTTRASWWPACPPPPWAMRCSATTSDMARVWMTAPTTRSRPCWSRCSATSHGWPSHVRDLRPLQPVIGPWRHAG